MTSCMVLVNIRLPDPQRNGTLKKKQEQVPCNHPDHNLLLEVPEGTHDLNRPANAQHGDQEDGHGCEHVP